MTNSTFDEGFIVGFLEAEGHVSKDNYQIIISNTDVYLLRLFRDCCKKVGISLSPCGIVQYWLTPNKIAYRLFISKKENLLKLKEIYEKNKIVSRDKKRLDDMLSRYKVIM